MEDKPLNKNSPNWMWHHCKFTYLAKQNLPSFILKTPSPLTESWNFLNKFSSVGKTDTGLPLTGPHFLTRFKRLRKTWTGIYCVNCTYIITQFEDSYKKRLHILDKWKRTLILEIDFNYPSKPQKCVTI